MTLTPNDPEPQSTGTFSGTWVNSSSDFTDMLRGRLAENPYRDMDIRPRGSRWPWYPVIEGKAEVTIASPLADDGQGLSLTMQTRWIDQRTTRLGFRRWLRHLLRRQ